MAVYSLDLVEAEEETEENFAMPAPAPAVVEVKKRSAQHKPGVLQSVAPAPVPVSAPAPAVAARSSFGVSGASKQPVKNESAAVNPFMQVLSSAVKPDRKRPPSTSTAAVEAADRELDAPALQNKRRRSLATTVPASVPAATAAPVKAPVLQKPVSAKAEVVAATTTE